MSGWDCGWGWDHNKNDPCDLKPEGLENVFCLLVHVSEKFQSYFSPFYRSHCWYYPACCCVFGRVDLQPIRNAIKANQHGGDTGCRHFSRFYRISSIEKATLVHWSQHQMFWLPHTYLPPYRSQFDGYVWKGSACISGHSSYVQTDLSWASVI